MTNFDIRPLVFEDLDQALRLSTIVGWNQLRDDWRMLLRLAPAGAFAAVVDAHIVGTAIGIDYGSFAWISMMLVDPAYRGRGLGRRLLEAAIDAVPRNLPVRLDATPLGRPLYQRYGFEDEEMLSRHVAQRSSAEGAFVSETADNPIRARPLASSDLQVIIKQDREVFGGTRGAVLEWMFQSAAQYAYVARSDDGLANYCLGRPGRLFDQIGPVVAGSEDIAQSLVGAALAAAGDRPVGIDTFDSQQAFAAWLGSRGFVIQRPLIRMCRPAESGVSAAGATRADSLRRGTEFAILGPEFA